MTNDEKFIVAPPQDPATWLTPAELALVADLDLNSNRDDVLARLKGDLQGAIEVELATIPIYLYSYYSVKRTEKTGENIRPCDLYANKAGGMIMSVAIEEMLHMTLSCNILYSLGVQPQLYKKAPGPYPTGLPYHKKTGPVGPDGSDKVLIPLSKLSYEQLWHFLQIEYPETADAWPEDRNWQTIGQFYSYIRCLVCTKFITDDDFTAGSKNTQVQSDNYSPNCVNSIYPDDRFDPWAMPPPNGSSGQSAAAVAQYPNSPDSHAGLVELLTVDTKSLALLAMDTICDQGEGYARPWGAAEPTDDPSKSEFSHYFKFLRLQAQMEEYGLNPSHQEGLPANPKAPDAISPAVSQTELDEVIVNFPDNPITACYPPDLQPISDFCNGVFQYMLIMTETVYKLPPEEQKLFFNIGMHRSMIWVLDPLIDMMRDIEITEGPYAGPSTAPVFMAPTFENINLGTRKTAFSALVGLGKAAVAASADKSYASSVTGLVATATTAKSDGQSMHLPDVSPYW